jgi:phosphatidate cytidylyltransferase
MLKQRIITALVLLAILLPAVFYRKAEAFAVVALVLISAASWEWARLNQSSPFPAVLWGLACAVACIGAWAGGLLHASLPLLWIVSSGGWVILCAWLLQSGVAGWGRVPRMLRLAGGLVALWTAWLAVVQARIIGINFLFSVLFLVWAADVFAYFAGRTLGGRLFARKLAPSISPGKTWEGVLGGAVGVMVIALVWRNADAVWLISGVSLYSRLAHVGTFFMLLALLFLTMMSVVGDLAESLFKRSAGVKDSSALLPGHGGVLDRVDALLPILPIAMMLSTL